MFKPRPKKKISDRVKGWIQLPIQYEDRLGTKKWSQFFGKYENQKWGGFDTDSCYALAPVNAIEDQAKLLELTGQFSQEAMDFFNRTGLRDKDGDFSFSEMFYEIKSNDRRNGGTAEQTFQLMQEWGFIPRSMLQYSLERMSKFNGVQKDIEDDYFNPANITPEMEALGEESKKYLNVAYQTIGKKWFTPFPQVLKAALQQAPLCIGVPVPTNIFNWNSSLINYDGNKILAHEIELYDLNDQNQYLIFDQYEPHLKTLSANYYVPIVTQGILYAVAPAKENPVIQDSWQVQFWSAVNHFWNEIKDNYPVGRQV